MGGSVNLAYDYPVLGLFWTAMWVFLWVLWIFLLFRVVADIFRDDSLSGWGKTGWLVFVLVLPFVGVLIYVIARGADMGRRSAEERQRHRDAYLHSTGGHGGGAVGGGGAGGGGASEADQLAKLGQLRAHGDITDEEFRRAKEKILH
jgi:uncharacterized membrane protein YgcG